MILITGGTGFLGKHIVRELLNEGYELRLLVRNTKNRTLPDWAPMVEIVEGDILDVLSLEKAMQGVDQVVHAAAYVSFWRKEWEKILKINVEGTANVVNACLHTGIRQLVHVSSIAAIGITKDGSLITEETSWSAGERNSWYSKSKYRAELEVYRGIAEGLQAVMVNPSVILGSDEQWEEGTPKMFSIVDKGLKFYNPGANGFVAVQDVARAIALLLDREKKAGSRYLLSAENLSFQELFGWIAEDLGKKAPIYRLPEMPTLWVGRISEWISRINGRPPIVSLESMRSAILSRA
ncbi:MAG: SDR family NAD(P)-dependent oxidoreductase, partial [Bacteroidota bacterium]